MSTINVFLTTFPGIGLPRTLNVQVPSTSTIGDVERIILNRLPSNATNLILTTTDNKLLSSHRQDPVTSLLHQEGQANFLPVRLSAALCGGKGGFGSQLRAAGGRISSRKKRAQGEQNGSSRTLDGRRIRTVNEAKALAEYLAIKPEMEKHEKDERRKRLEEIVQSTEARKAEILSGTGAGKSKIDSEWLENKEAAAEKAREAVLAALKRGDVQGVFGEEARESDESGSGSEDEASESEEVEEKKSEKQAPMKFFAWDDELSDSEDEEDGEDPAQDTEAPSKMSPETTNNSGTKSRGKARSGS